MIIGARTLTARSETHLSSRASAPFYADDGSDDLRGETSQRVRSEARAMSIIISVGRHDDVGRRLFLIRLWVGCRAAREEAPCRAAHRARALELGIERADVA